MVVLNKLVVVVAFYCIFHQTSFDDTDQLDWQIFYWIGKEASVSILFLLPVKIKCIIKRIYTLIYE